MKPRRALEHAGRSAQSAVPPLFCVVMPALDAAATVEEAVGSVLAQTRADWELVVVDDGSTDRTGEAVERCAAGDPRITVLRRRHAGPAAARNTGARAGTAPFLLRLDADDVLLPACLATYAAFIEEHPGYDIYSCSAEVFTAAGVLSPYYTGERARHVMEFTLEQMLERNIILGPAAVCTRAVFERVGGMREGVYVEDYDFWLRALAAGARHVFVPRVLVRYRLHPGQMSRDVRRMQASEAEVLEALAASGALDARLAARARAAAAAARRSGGDTRGLTPQP